MPRLVDLVEKIENSGQGAFLDINNDLGLFIEKNSDCDSLIKMSYAYARRAAVAGMVLQGIVKQEDYNYVYQVFLGMQQATDTSTTGEQMVDFQDKAVEQSIELIASYTSLFDKKAILSLTNAVHGGRINTQLREGETHNIETIAAIVNDVIKRVPESLSNMNDQWIEEYKASFINLSKKT